MYLIGEVSKKFSIPTSTIRFYDKEGLLINLKRDPSGIRKFSDSDMDTITVIECLKRSGMQLKDIKYFLELCQVGDSTIEERKELFYHRRKEVERQMLEFQKTLDFIQYKCWYYETASEDGTETNVKTMPIDDLPEEIKECYQNSHQ